MNTRATKSSYILTQLHGWQLAGPQVPPCVRPAQLVLFESAVALHSYRVGGCGTVLFELCVTFDLEDKGVRLHLHQLQVRDKEGTELH